MERYVIHVTKDCNLNCYYCYEKDKSSQYSEAEVLVLAKNIADNCRGVFSVEFLGGEPLLGFENMKSCYDYLNQRTDVKVADFIVTTNGTILNDEIKSFIKKDPRVIFAVSIDGGRWANQLRTFKESGKNSFEAVERNLKVALEEFPKQVAVHLVTHPYNVYLLHKSICYLYSLGVRFVGVGTVESTMTIDDRYCARFVEELEKTSRAIVEGSLTGLYVDVLEQLKPASDVRTYIKDPYSGKTLAESYGRVQGDVTSSNFYNSVRTTSPIENTIYRLRRTVYENHWEKIQNLG